jgi:predicted glycosyltransferase
VRTTSPAGAHPRAPRSGPTPLRPLPPDRRPPEGDGAITPERRIRVALYSHDSTGLGHVRRNLLLAARFAADGHDVLIVSGSPESSSMTRPPGTDLVTLPALAKGPAGDYRARHLSLGLSELRALRRDILTSTLVGFCPDLLVVDRHARGFLGELEPALDRSSSTRVVLGLRDVLDAPARVQREWREQETERALEAWYDEVWIYGDDRYGHPLDTAGVCTPVPALPLGYLRAARPRTRAVTTPATDAPFVLCTVGGGSDGAATARAVLDAGAPAGHRAVIVTGPQMPAEQRGDLEERASGRSEVVLTSFVHELPDLLRRARAAIVMGGYNTVCEVLTTSTPTLVVPRERPRSEQRLRAERLAAGGHLDTLSAELAVPAVLRAWLDAAVARPRRPRVGIDLGGLDRASDRAAALLARTAGPARPGTEGPRPADDDEGADHVAV